MSGWGLNCLSRFTPVDRNNELSRDILGTESGPWPRKSRTTSGRNDNRAFESIADTAGCSQVYLLTLVSSWIRPPSAAAMNV